MFSNKTNDLTEEQDIRDQTIDLTQNNKDVRSEDDSHTSVQFEQKDRRRKTECLLERDNKNQATQ